MQKITLFIIMFLAFWGTIHAQKVAIIGYNGTTNDGYSIVALETIPGGTTIYFTDKPYLGSGSFGINEGAWAYTTPAGGLSLGDVVVFTESSTNNMTMICNIGGTDGSGATCGTWGSLNGDVSLASTSAETIYAYADNNNDPSSGVTEIYAALITSGAIGSDGATNPLGEFPNAVIVDNLNSDITIDYIDFKNSLRSSVGASKASIIAALEGPASNYNQGTGNTALSRVPFTAPSNPVLTMTGPTNSPVIEDNGPNLSFVFTLTPAPSSNVTINFSVGGTASFPSDYTASGGTISGATGTIVISTSGTATLTLNPVEDSVLEPYETVTITPTTGTGYDLGGGGATGTIANDDKLVSCPLVAITGVNHTDADGFSFVALTDLSAGSFVYFTDATFNNTSLKYTVATDAVLKWTVPSGVQRGDVFVVKETSNNSNAYALSCSDGTGATCGTLANIVADFSIATNGAAFSAYADTDDDPTNGISEIYSVLYTGTSSVSGGNIPAIEDPFTVYSKAVVVDGWSVLDGAPNRTEYKPGLRNVTVSQGNFEDLSKWDHGAANADLSTTPFSNIIICEGNVNPPVTVTVSPASVDEDSGTPIVFTFTLNGPPMGDFDVSFDVSGTATYLTDYTVTTQIGNSSFNGTTGVVTIPNVTGSNTITVTPIGDSDLEPDETVILSIASGANYDAGNPGSATGTINNDDVGPSTCPLVAITGMNHVNPDGFSFVALTNIPAGTEIYFTDKPFDNNTFLFGINETVVKWTAPSGVNQGDVFFVKETAENVFSLTCNSGTCGTFSLLATEFSFGTDGDELYAYLDDDDDPENGVTEIIAALYTGASGAPGGNIPASEDPSTIYPSSILVDGFSASQPNRTEYNPAGRNVSVVQADFQNTTNWLHAQGNADLSTTAFANIEILLSISCPADQLSLEGCSPYYVILASSLPYSETAQTISEADFLADGGTINSGGTITNITYMDAVSGTFPFTVTRTFTVTDECPSTTTCEQTFIIDDTMGPNGNVTLPPLNFSCPSEIPAPDISLVTGFTDNCTATCEVWINELHYDNTGTDVGEFIEVAGPAGTDLSSYSIVYYNGANSNTYDSPQVLSGIIDNESTGFGALSFAKTGIQNGNPDGLALVKNGTNVIEFLSYGGVFTANNGPAAGMTSTDIGVTEPNTQAIGESLSRNGTGGKGIDFTFADGPQSPGDLNPLQTMTPVPCGNVVTVTFFGDVNNGGAGSAGDPLVITRTYHAQDPAGNVTPVTQTITVIDNTLPVPVCPADITVNNDSGICGANVSFSVPATDNCGTAIVTFSQNPGTIFSGGMTNVTATATDAAGNQATCSFKVTVNDNEDPDINCPANITVGNDTGQCGADVSFAATATDNCTAVTIDYSIPSGSFFPAGSPTTVTATATDATNRTASCTFTVTVNDTQAPAITCPQNITVGNTQGECGTVVNYTTPSSDNCGVVNVTYTNNLGNTVDPGSFFPIDTFTVFVRAFDLAGNNTYCRFRIEVIEDKPAVAVCKTGPVTVDLTSDGNTILNPAAIDGGSYSCGGFTLSVLPNVFNCDDVGSTVSVTLTAADNFYDVYSPPTTCMTTVTIADPNAFCCAPPDAICKPATIYLNEDGLASLSVDQINDNSTADCGFQYPMTLSEYIYTCSDMAQYIPVTLTVTDINGAVDECTTTVMVIDNIPPSIECPAGFSVNNDPGQCGALVDLPWPAYNDNCSIVALGFRSIQVDPDNGNAEIGSFSDWFNIPYIPYDPQITLGVGTWKIEWRTQDQSGLFDYCDLIITVNDNEDPAISCPISPISSGTDPGVCGANVPFNVSATDNCGDVTVVCTIGGDNGGGSGNCATNNLNLSLTFDNYPQETSWMILQLPQ
ncbi:MAG: HYR domain-containing protein, partial [Saprospiraceae bacterium]|nr:HYR domain-containing protein [Saprospiraceae bacterium]